MGLLRACVPTAALKEGRISQASPYHLWPQSERLRVFVPQVPLSSPSLAALAMEILLLLLLLLMKEKE